MTEAYWRSDPGLRMGVVSVDAMDSRIAVFLDYENLAISARQDLGVTFDYGPVADAIAARGRVVVRRGYADWNLFDEDRKRLTRHHVELIEIPQRMGKRKNAADIKLAVDAIELALERDYIDTFVLGTGDSDFSPLVHKLRELDKRVIGFGVRKTTSNLLPPACDEFLFYERLVDLDGQRSEPEEPRSGEPEQKERTVPELEKLVMGTLAGLHTTGDTAVLASQLKRTLLRKDSTFSESEYGFRSFGELVHHLEGRGILTTAPGPAAGDPEIAVAEGGGEKAAFDLLVKVVTAEAKRGRVQLSGLKNKLRNEVDDFSEKTYGFSGFLQFVKAAQTRGLVTLTWDDDLEDYLLTV